MKVWTQSLHIISAAWTVGLRDTHNRSFYNGCSAVALNALNHALPIRWWAECALPSRLTFLVLQFLSSVWLWDPMDSTPGSSVFHYLPEFVQIHIHQVSDAIWPPHPLTNPSLPSSFPRTRIFSNELALHISGQSVGASASAPVLPVSIQGWFPLELTVRSPCSPRDSQKSSPAPQFKSINSLTLSLLYGSTLTPIHDYWETIGLTTWTLTWMSLLFNTLSRLVMLSFQGASIF